MQYRTCSYALNEDCKLSGCLRLLNTLKAMLMDESECSRQPALLYGLQVNERLVAKIF